ncbi:MAG TPA: hypothetical protein VHC86_06585 [Opitutaceae bacterium]|nr:hypothetical protein [Opitutaceae bacterium]
MIRLSTPLEVEYVWFLTAAFVMMAALWRGRGGGRPWSRNAISALGAVWIVFCTMEYWAFGPHSALGRPDEYNVSIPWVYYLARFHPGREFIAGYSGGVDGLAGVGFGTEHFSIERCLFKVLPLWLAVSAMNVGAIGLAFAGTYRLTRALFRLPRSRAAAVGILISAAPIVNLAWAAGGIGWGIAALPLGFYLVGVRAGRRWHWLGTAAFGVLFSSSTALVHTLPAFCIGCAFAAIALPLQRQSRAFAAGGAVILISLVNWSGSLRAIISLAPDLARANAPPIAPTWLDQLQSNADVVFLPLGILALAGCWVLRDRRAWRLLAGFVAAFFSGHVLAVLPWGATGLRVLSGYRWDLCSDSYFLLAALLAGALLERLPSGRIRRWGWLAMPPWPETYLGILALIAVADHKAINLLNYRLYGGADLFQDVPLNGLRERAAGEPFRVVTDYSLFAPNTANAYGLETFDGSVQAFTLRQNEFYGFAVQRPPNPRPHTHVHFLAVPSGTPSAGEVVNLDALRIANVRFLLSGRTLGDRELKEVLNQPLCLHPYGDRLASWLIGRAPSPPRRLIVYELPAEWPRAFVPAELRFSRWPASAPEFYRELLASAEIPFALVAKDDQPQVPAERFSPAAIRLRGFSSAMDGGLDLALGPGERPGRGLVVVNLPYVRFWRAASRGTARTIFPVNGIHLAVVVEPGDQAIELRYRRP